MKTISELWLWQKIRAKLLFFWGETSRLWFDSLAGLAGLPVPNRSNRPVLDNVGFAINSVWWLGKYGLLS